MADPAPEIQTSTEVKVFESFDGMGLRDELLVRMIMSRNLFGFALP
jgi:hypothetical protein